MSSPLKILAIAAIWILKRSSIPRFTLDLNTLAKNRGGEYTPPIIS